MTADGSLPVFPDAKFMPEDFMLQEAKEERFWLRFQLVAGVVLIAGGILSAVKAALGIPGLGGPLAVLYTPPVCYILAFFCVCTGLWFCLAAHRHEIVLRLW